MKNYSLVSTNVHARFKCLPALLFWMTTSLVSHGQSLYSPPSPNAQALARYAAVPVSYYTGTPAINVPIYTLPGKEISLPVSLSYNASGHKVKDIASWVGLGWSLNAGGVITRIVRGLPDEDENGYCGNPSIGNKAVDPYSLDSLDENSKDEYFGNVMAGNWDGEPDMFYFNFMGRAGRFVIDPAGKPYSIPHQNLLIKPGICRAGATEWVIIDENGTRYIFGGTPEAKEMSITNYMNGNPLKTHISSWYLSRIERANGSDVIYFSYQSSQAIAQYYRTDYEVSCQYSVDCPDLIKEGNGFSQVTVTTTPRYPSKVWNSWGSVEFKLAPDTRDDLEGGRLLKEIVVKDKNLNIVKTFQFDYGYFSSGCSREECKRLKLNGVYEDWLPLVNFTYEESINLPPRDSYSYDHWGYANASTSTTGIGQKYPDPVSMMANHIKEITYPQGVKTVFEFEPHDYLYTTTETPDGSMVRLNKVIGGLRVKTITTVSEENSETINYSYTLPEDNTFSSGKIYAIPSYTEQIFVVSGPTCTKTYASSVTALFDLGGAHIGYSDVKETRAFSSTRYAFTNFETNPDEHNPLKNLGGNIITLEFQPPFVQGDYRGWERGLLLEQTVYNQDGKLLSKTTNTYDFTMPVKKALNGVVVAPYYILGSNCTYSNYAAGIYTLTSKPFNLKQTTTYVYDLYDQSSYIATTQKYLYDINTNQPIETIVYNPHDSTTRRIEKTAYVTSPQFDASTGGCEQDYHDCLLACYYEGSSQAACDACATAFDQCLAQNPLDSETKAIMKLRGKHIINAPVEQLTVFEANGIQNVISATYVTFQTIGPGNDKVVPYKSYFNPHMASLGSYTPATIDNGNFIPPAIAGTQYLLSGEVGFDAVTGLVTKTIAPDGTTKNYSYDSYGIINNITTTNGTLVTTESQVAQPLIGVVSLQDANQRQVFYEYDQRERLLATKDHDGNIVNRYRYNTATPRMAVLEVQGNTYLAGDEITFTTANSYDYGQTRFIWDLGTGTVYENNLTRMSQVYPAGSYRVSVTLSNPEYEVLHAAETVTIYDQMSGTIKSGGSNMAYTYSWCTNQGVSFSFTLALNGGCPGASFKWYLKKAPFAYEPIGPAHTVATVGQYTVKCEVTDGCGNTYTVTKNFEVVNNDCPGQGQDEL